MTYFEQYFQDYMNDLEKFKKFHNEVINMPRDEFSNTGLRKMRTLAGYLLLTEGKTDPTGVTYKDLRGQTPVAFRSFFLFETLSFLLHSHMCISKERRY